MVSVNKLRSGTCFSVGGKPFRVIEYQHKHLSRGGGTVKLKVRNLVNGTLSRQTYKSTEKVDLIEVEKKKLQFLYREGKSYYFMEPSTFEQIEVSQGLIGDLGDYLIEGDEVGVLFWDDKFIELDLPAKVIMKVVEADPGEKGDSASNVYKEAVLEGGKKIRVPLFVKPGDQVKIDTRTGEYVERV